MDCLLTKLWAVELVSISNCHVTPGIDGISFLSVPRATTSKSVALKILHNTIQKLKYDISLSEGATNQSIQRKGIYNLNSREIYRRYLKSKVGKIYIKNRKHLNLWIENDPVAYVSHLRSKALQNNFKLKFNLLESLKPFKIKKYSSDPIIRVFVPKDSRKLRFLGILTFKDKTMRTFLKLAMESYMEPLGDRNSFGFRPGRNCHQAIAYLYHRLSIRISNTFENNRGPLKKRSTLNPQIKKNYGFSQCSNKYKQIITSKDVSKVEIQKWLSINEKQHHVPFYLLHADIENCFDKISHNWLISNVPITSKYNFLLKQVLKSDVIENKKVVLKKCDNKCGVLQGGVLSPLLIN